MRKKQQLVTRRGFMKASALGAGALASGIGGGKAAFGIGKKKRPNFAFITCDQLLLDAISAHGCSYVRTPNIDRVFHQGISFVESHSTCPVCSPARSSWFTGCMACETGVVSNKRAINASVPTMGTWFRQNGYETVYSGKHHLPFAYPTEIKGFTVLPNGRGQGDLLDPITSRNCEAYLRNRRSKAPFVLFAGFVQPHDICYYAMFWQAMTPEKLPFPELAGQLPPVPPNNRVFPREPKPLAEGALRYKFLSDDQWRYYLYAYYRMVEMLDADVGRILDTLEDTGLLEDTIVIFTSDHGEGAGRHAHVEKWYPYEESVKVPLIVSCPERFASGRKDYRHLVSGIDIMPTMCDFAGITPPPQMTGRSLRPVLEDRPTEWREFVAAEWYWAGWMIRTEQFKYVWFPDDPIEQLFDMTADPWETTNLFDQTEYAGILKDHRRLLNDWEASLSRVELSPVVKG